LKIKFQIIIENMIMEIIPVPQINDRRTLRLKVYPGIDTLGGYAGVKPIVWPGTGEVGTNAERKAGMLR
jgi:hypothetical protein